MKIVISEPVEYVKEETKKAIRYPYFNTAGFWCSVIRYRRLNDNKIVTFTYHYPQMFRYVQYKNLVVGGVYKYHTERGLINFLFIVEEIDGNIIHVRVIKDLSKDDLDWTGMQTQFVMSDEYSEEIFITKVKKEDLPLELLK